LHQKSEWEWQYYPEPLWHPNQHEEQHDGGHYEEQPSGSGGSFFCIHRKIDFFLWRKSRNAKLIWQAISK